MHWSERHVRHPSRLSPNFTLVVSRAVVQLWVVGPVSTMSDFANFIAESIVQMRREQAQRTRQIFESQVELPHLHSGTDTFDALMNAVQELGRVAPEDCDVFVQVGEIAVVKTHFIKPHTFSFEGINQHGHLAWEVVHFSQLHASVIFRPKRGPKRFITSFSNLASD